MRIVCLFIICLVVSIPGWGQDRKSLSPEAFLQQVARNHPTAQQARLLREQSRALQLEARGGFDPKLSMATDYKSFDQKNYYQLGDGTLKIPTQFGLSFKTGYVWGNGVFLNPQNFLPTSGDNGLGVDGQALVGIQLPILQGLFVDEARTNLRIAKEQEAINFAQSQLLINDLLYAAGLVYWEWAFQEYALETYEQAVRLTEQQLEQVKQSYLQGDRPAIDTLEVYLQLQNRRVDLQQASLDLTMARNALSNFLWAQQAGDPEEIASFAANSPLNPTVNNTIDDLLINGFQQLFAHPKLRSYRGKLKQLEVEQRWQREQFKPELNLEYNLLANGLDFSNEKVNNGGSDFNLFTENYKWGLQFSFPLFVRKARGKQQQVSLKIRDTELGMTQELRELQNKWNNYAESIENLRVQLGQYQQVVEHYQRLLEAEQIKFSIGESSVFLLNSREQKLLEANLKLLKIATKLQQSTLAIRWATGVLGQ